MAYKPRLTLCLTLLVLGSSCHSAAVSTARTPAQLAGSYVFERSGHNRGRDWRINSVLTLSEAGSFVLDRRIVTEREPEDEVESGTYRIVRDKLLLCSDRNESTELRIQGDSLIAKLDWPGRWFARWIGGPPVFIRRR